MKGDALTLGIPAATAPQGATEGAPAPRGQAMLEIFLYDWWPIRAEAKLLDRLSEMDVRVVGSSTSADTR